MMANKSLPIPRIAIAFFFVNNVGSFSSCIVCSLFSCYFWLNGSFSWAITSDILIHLAYLLPLTEGFTLTLCCFYFFWLIFLIYYFEKPDSFMNSETFNSMIHSSILIRRDAWFIHFPCYFNLPDSFLLYATSYILIRSLVLKLHYMWLILFTCYFNLRDSFAFIVTFYYVIHFSWLYIVRPDSLSLHITFALLIHSFIMILLAIWLLFPFIQ